MTQAPAIKKLKAIEIDTAAIKRSNTKFNLHVSELFGLKTNGRIESIFMSLPPTVRWEYNFQPTKNSSESELVSILKKPKEWI